MSDDTLRTLSRSFDWRTGPLSWPVTTEVGAGLAGVVAAETRVMWLDPSSGRLTYRDVPIDTLADSPNFEEVSFLLITGSTAVQDPEGWSRFRDNLRTSRWIPPEVVAILRDLDPQTHPTRVLRAGVSALGCHELSASDDLAGDRHWRELRIVGQVVGLVAEIVHHRRGVASAAVAADQSLASGMLRAVTGSAADEEDVEILDLLWTLYAAHGLDAPTFTSMVVASCLADPYYNVVAGLSALRGTKQGGASEIALKQLLALEGPDRAESWVRHTIEEGGFIAGFGHPEYRMPDPRVVILRKAAASLARRKGRPELYESARAVEEAATRRLTPKNIHINVNFYGSLLFHLLGADPPLVPCLIAVARMAGLVALVRESLDSIRLYRPRSRYVGVPERSMLRQEDPP
jgi:citrate synthase